MDPRDGLDRLQPALGLPDEGVGGVEIVASRGLRRQALQALGDRLQDRQQVFVGHVLRFPGCGASMPTGASISSMLHSAGSVASVALRDFGSIARRRRWYCAIAGRW